MASTARSLSDDDKAFLLEELDRLNHLQIDIGESLFFVVGNGFVMTCILNIVWVGFWRFTGRLHRVSDWQTDPLVFWGAMAIAAGSLSYLAYEILRSEFSIFRNRKRRRKLLLRELSQNQASAAKLTVVDAKCLQEPEHLMKIYLLKMSDGRIRVRYDYNSADLDGKGISPRTKFRITKEMTMIHFKHLDEYRYVFGPTNIQKPPAFELNLPPDKWPEDETWLYTPWEDIATFT